jgi:hypothetical protein
MPIEPGNEAKQEGSQHNDRENSNRGPLLVTQPAVAWRTITPGLAPVSPTRVTLATGITAVFSDPREASSGVLARIIQLPLARQSRSLASQPHVQLLVEHFLGRRE